jgi:hypothetical protein
VTIYRGTYYSADGCDSSPRPGTDALVSWYLGAYAARGAANLGTYVCKRLGSGWSIHAERRAADLGTAPYGGVDSEWGWAFANALRLHSAELGVQLIILGRKVWSCRYPDSGWRDYGGEYHGHAHVELTPSASMQLTTSKIQNTIGAKETFMALTPDDEKALIWRAEALARGRDKVIGGPTKDEPVETVQILKQARNEAVLAKELAGQVGLRVAELQGKVDELLARPPAVIDYDALADAIVRRVVTGPAPAPEGS